MMQIVCVGNDVIMEVVIPGKHRVVCGGVFHYNQVIQLFEDNWF